MEMRILTETVVFLITFKICYQNTQCASSVSVYKMEVLSCLY